MNTIDRTPASAYSAHDEQARILSEAQALQGAAIASAFGALFRWIASAARQLRTGSQHGGTAHPTAA